MSGNPVPNDNVAHVHPEVHVDNTGASSGSEATEAFSSLNSNGNSEKSDDFEHIITEECENGPEKETQKVRFSISEEDEITDKGGMISDINNFQSSWKGSRKKARHLRQSMSGTHLLQQGKEASRIDGKDFTVATPEEFVKRFGGNRVINKILIANNGIAAVKCMRSIRRWAYEMFRNVHVVRFVVMVTPEDLKANAEYIKLADHYVHVPGGTNNNNYANVELILDIAKRLNVQAVWAGWGHASENPKLPELLHKSNIAFMGPPEKAMWALGDKIASSIVAQTAGIPTLPWNGSGLKAEWNESFLKNHKRVKIQPELYKKGCLEDVDEALALELYGN
ncbi:acetyl-CoA carboxylase-like [Limulus polyphemus]|uniref:Acetyl-CoA carboxylase-like n=1 Tax=Limulus polyphemus TaxID=6850 RepID=A0ABM1S3W6_LIMPO|nr:acetyl-CoA carboxylase-like [Limulus polyphemus]